MDIKTEIKDGATVSVSLDLAPEGVSRIRIVADSPETRDRAMAQVQKVLPQMQRLEDALIAEDLERDPVVRRSWFIRLSLHRFFKGIHPDGAVLDTIDYQDEGCCFTNFALADRCVQKLAALKIVSRAELLTAPRRQSTITTNLETLGFAPEPVTAESSANNQ